MARRGDRMRRRSPAWPLGLWLVLGGSAAGLTTMLYLAALGAWVLLREAWEATR